MPRFTTAALAFLCTVTGLLAAAPAHPGALEDIRATGELRLAYRTDTPPFSSPGPNGEPQGFTIDLCKTIAADIQTTLGMPELRRTWVKVNADDRIDAIASGRAHLECGTTTITLARMERVDFSNLTYATGAGLMRRKDSNVNTVADLAGKRVSVVSGTTTEPALREALENAGIEARVIPVKNHAEALRLLVDRKTDAMAGDQATLLGIGFVAKAEHDLVITEELMSFEPFALPLPRNDADFRLVVNRSLSNFYLRGDVGRSWEQWFGQYGVRPTQALLTLYRLNSFAE